MKKKIDYILWAFMWILPVLAFFISFYRTGNDAIYLLQYINENFSFAFVKDVFDNIWQTVFNSDLAISGYLSYLVVVEIAHCMFDAIVFIPRIAHGFIDRFAGGDVL